MNDHDRYSSGALVCVEGIDGAGKTTAVAATAELLRQRGIPAVLVDRHHLTGGSEHSRRHLRALADLIWAHPGDDPHQQFGDQHWVYLQAAWYAGLSRCLVDPLVNGGHLVLADTWTHNLLAKLSLRPNMDLKGMSAAFADTCPPDLILLLRVDPQIAALRKHRYTISDSPDDEGPVHQAEQAFIAYQQRLSDVLDHWAARDRWLRIDANSSTPERVAQQVAGEIMAWLAGRPGDAPPVRPTAGTTAGRPRCRRLGL